ncbi:hypothetical protein RUND412_011069 [Rhizina undulata]
MAKAFKKKKITAARIEGPRPVAPLAPWAQRPQVPAPLIPQMNPQTKTQIPRGPTPLIPRHMRPDLNLVINDLITAIQKVSGERKRDQELGSKRVKIWDNNAKLAHGEQLQL